MSYRRYMLKRQTLEEDAAPETFDDVRELVLKLTREVLRLRCEVARLSREDHRP